MKRKEKKAVEALKLLGLSKDVSKEDIIKKTDELTKENYEGNSCKNYTELTEIFQASQFLINHHQILKDLDDEQNTHFQPLKPLK